jgi:predicted porin
MAKLGAGYQVSNVTGNTGSPNAKVTDWLVGAKIPMGASSFGVTFTSRTWDDAAALGLGLNNGTGTGYSLEYGYAMSKRTSIIANYARWTQASSGVLTNPDASNQYQLLLSHSF